MKEQMTPIQQREKERLKVYDVLTTFGPDVDGQRVGRILPRVRKELAKYNLTILGATVGQIDSALDEIGMYGRAGDSLRTDKYF
jgi:hypothetical protein